MSNIFVTTTTSNVDFVLLRSFGIGLHPLNVSFLKEDIWAPIIDFWVKCNIDGFAQGGLGSASCDDILRYA